MATIKEIVEKANSINKPEVKTVIGKIANIKSMLEENNKKINGEIFSLIVQTFSILLSQYNKEDFLSFVVSRKHWIVHPKENIKEELNKLHDGLLENEIDKKGISIKPIMKLMAVCSQIRLRG